MTPRTLRSYVLVGKFVSPDEMRALSQIRDAKGNALGRRRLIALAWKERVKRKSLAKDNASEVEYG